LPIDFQNKANVGYAFLNFIHPLFIIDFVKEFSNRKWSKFKSNKKGEIKYARIQGIDNLENHFRMSSVMNQSDEMLKPRIFVQNRMKNIEKELSMIIQKYKGHVSLHRF